MASVQVPLNCDLCGNVEINWRCMNCKELLCEQCKTIHLKSKASRDHRVLSLADLTLDECQKKEQDEEVKVKCEVHPKEMYQRYCKTCDCLICIECILSGHKEHTFSTISDCVDIRRNELAKAVKILKNSALQELTNIISGFQYEKARYGTEMKRLISEIEQRATELKTEIDRIRDELITELQNQQRLDVEAIRQYDQIYQTQLTEIKELITNVDDVIGSMTGTELLKVFADIRDQIVKHNKQLIKPEPLSLPYFVTQKKESDKTILKKIYGYTENKQRRDASKDRESEIIQKSHPEMKKESENTKQKQSVVECTVVNKITCQKGDAYHICPTHNKALIYTPKHLEFIDQNGRHLKSEELYFYAQASAVTSSGDVLLTDKDGKRIRKMSHDCTLTTLRYTFPNSPYGITVTDSGFVLVSHRNEYNPSSKSIPKGGQVERLSSNGDLLNTYQYDTADQSVLFPEPFHLTQNVNGDIWVGQYNRPQVVVINKAGKRRFVYTRIDYPYNIDHNKYGQVAIVDFEMKQIHLVDMDGNFLCLITIKNDDDYKPQALAHDLHGNLWIGCASNKIFVLKYNVQ